MANEALAEHFHEAMIDIYRRRLREIRYPATELKRWVEVFGGVGAARKALEIREVSSGLERLYHEDRLDLSVQWLVLDPQYEPLFTLNERRSAYDQLAEQDFDKLSLRPRP